MQMLEKQFTIKEQIRLFPIKQEKREQIKKSVLAKHGITPLNYVPTKRQMFWSKKILDNGITREILLEMESEIKEEKMIANIAFGGNLGDYREFKRRMKQDDMDKELRLIRNGKHEIFIEEEELTTFFADENDAKTAHAENYAPVIATHKDKGGSKTSFTPRSIIQDVYSEINSKNITFHYTVGQLQAELEPTHGLIPKPILLKIAKEINNSLAEWEADAFGQNSGVMEKKVMEPITQFCKENASDDFEKSNNMGEKARNIVNAIGPELGKAIGTQIVKSEENKSDPESAKEAIAGITVKALKATSKVYQEPLEESIHYTIGILESMLKKK